jgi:hypothetical protein
MKITALPNGNLKMEFEPGDADRWNEIKCTTPDTIEHDGTYVAEALFIEKMLPDYVQTTPEAVGALTSAPIIQKGEDVWGYMDYQVYSFIEQLLAGNTVVWQKG